MYAHYLHLKRLFVDGVILLTQDPQGQSLKNINYDNLFRTVEDTDVANLTDKTEWDTYKDLALSTTDETGLKSTTLYDDEDRPIDSYGPAPAAWFGTDRKPLTTPTNYTNQVPHTQSAFDEGISGPAVSWFDYTKQTGNTNGVLSGAPKLHTTGINTATPGTLSYDFVTPPITATSGAQGIGLSATGKLRLPSGTYTISGDTSDGIRVWVDDQLILDNQWIDSAYRTVTSTNFTVSDAAPKRLRIDAYRRTGSTGTLNVRIQQQSGFAATTNWGSYLKPDYSLNTSSKVFDATIGDITTTTSYGANPELALPTAKTIDPTGVNLTTTMAYETQGATNGFLRQTGKTLPGGGTTTYTHYTANGTTSETRDNPCTTGVTEAFKQAGMLKLKTEPDPDGSGPLTGRATETIYDDAGRIVATRVNTDPWTCTTYDSRGRVQTTVVPDNDGSGPNTARTISNNYAVGGNPLVTSSGDGNGDITVTMDLLGRTTKYLDIFEDETNSVFDGQGHLTSRTSDLGVEEFVYDTFDRLTDQKLDGVTYAHINYDSLSRISEVTYPNAGQQKLVQSRDSMGKVNNLTYTLGNGTTTLSDAVSFSQSGQIISGTELGQGKSYTYDKAGRLTAATLGSNSWSYGFGATPAGQCTGTAYNANAGKNSNRTTTTQTVGGVTKTFTYCYDNADRLLSSTDPSIDQVAYDTRGNITSLGTSYNSKHTDIFYDSGGRNNGFWQNWGDDYDIYYERDVQNRIVSRYEAGLKTNEIWYGFTGGSDTPDFTRDANWNIVDKYLELPGGVILTIRPAQSGNAQKTYSLPNLHGDVFATTNTAGGQIATYQNDPFGQTIGTAQPGNTAASTSYGWVGQHEKKSEIDLAIKPIQMGERIYLPNAGRFAQVDPIEGGTANNYVYPPDPVNDFDLTGQFGWKNFVNVASVGSMIPGPIGMASAAVSAAAYAKAGDKKQALVMAGTIAAAAVGVGGAVKIYQMAKKTQGLARTVKIVKAAVKPIVKSITKERWLSPRVRVSPFGSWGARHQDGTANMAARLPHIHIAKKPVPNNPQARTSIKWHRPWQTVFRKWFR